MNNQKYFFISCKKTVNKQKLYDFIQLLLKYDTPKKISTNEYKNGGRIKYYPKRLSEAFEAEMTYLNERKLFSIDGEKISFIIRCERLDEALQLILIIDYDISDQLYSEIEKLIIEEAVLASERDSHDDAIQNQTEINIQKL